MSKVLIPKEVCSMPKDQRGYVSVWMELIPLGDSTSRIFSGRINANSPLDQLVSIFTNEPYTSFPGGSQIRLWDSYPTDEERETTPWEVEDHE